MNYFETLEKKYTPETRLSYSSLKHFYKSPLDFLKYINKDFSWTDPMILGSLTDCLLLEPEKFEEKFINIPNIDRRTKAGKEAWAELQKNIGDKIPVKKDLLDKANFMKEALEQNPMSKMLLNNTTEVQKHIEFKYKGLTIRGILDGFGEFDGKPFIFDLKTTSESDPKSWYRSIIKYMYHLQAAISQAGIFNEGFIMPDFYHIIVETAAPYKVSVVKFCPETLKAGKKILKKIVSDFNYCIDNDLWSEGYEFTDPNINEVSLPEWYLNILNNE